MRCVRVPDAAVADPNVHKLLALPAALRIARERAAAMAALRQRILTSACASCLR